MKLPGCENLGTAYEFSARDVVIKADATTQSINPISLGVKTFTHTWGGFRRSLHVGYFSTTDDQIWSIWVILDDLFENFKIITEL